MLAICRSVLERPIGWDEEFADFWRTLDRHRTPGASLAVLGMDGHSASAAQRLQYGTQSGDPNAARSVARRGSGTSRRKILTRQRWPR